MIADYLCPTGFSVGDLHVENLIKSLDEKKLKYATYMTLASWAGFPILLAQSSREAQNVHNFLSKFLTTYPKEKLQAAVSETGTPLFYLLEFCAQFYYNSSNYVGFGDTKILPRISKEELTELVKDYSELAELLEKCIEPMYNEEQVCLNIGFHPKGVTAYYNPNNFTEEEQQGIDKILNEQNVRIENTIVFRHEDKYEVKIMCVDVDSVGKQVGELNGLPVFVTKGLHSETIVKIVKWLELAKEVAEDNQKEMLGKLIDHYNHGDVADHVAYSELWVGDENPVIENYHGFIECYRDPAGIRCEFESFVACVDPAESEFLHKFVDMASVILNLMPYPKQYERNNFNPPSYNAINILSFCTSGMPIGINIPNYDEIRLSKGFKNVSLTNVMASRGATPLYIAEDQAGIYVDNFKSVLSLNVAAHELYGHGSGTLFTKDDVEGGKVPDLLTPGKTITTYYAEGETYQKVFGGLGPSFEECRAECTSLHLSFKDEVLEMYGIPAEKRADFKLCAALSMLHRALVSLNCYSPEIVQWKQAHARARFAILRACLIWGKDAVSVTKNGDSVVLRIDPDKFEYVVDAIEKLLIHLNYFKAARLVGPAKEFYGALTSMDDFWLEIRAITNAKKAPRDVICGAVVQKDGENYTLAKICADAPTILDMAMTTVTNVSIALE